MRPLLSVIIPTRDRPDAVARAVRSVLDQRQPCHLEVLVVDDGSSGEVAAQLDESLSSDAVVVLHQDNEGPARARAAGVAASRGEWLAFLDDDDLWLPAWGELLVPLMTGRGVAFVSGAAEFYEAGSGHRSVHPPRPLGPIFSDVTAQYLAGCFAVRRDLYEDAGGYLIGLSFSEQTELFIRVAKRLEERDLRSAWVDEPVVAVDRRSSSERPLARPRLVYDCTRWVLARHASSFSHDRVERANWEGVVAVNAARLGRRAVSLAWAMRSIRSDPWSVRRWVRAALLATPVHRHHSATEAVAYSDAPLAHAVSAARRGSPDPAHGGEAFLPWTYRLNNSIGALGAEWNPVEISGAVTRRFGPVLGSRSGRRPQAFLPSAVAVGQRPEHESAESCTAGQSKVLRLSGLERSPSPGQVLRDLLSFVAPHGVVELTALDRDLAAGPFDLGPPRGEHRQEWNRDELALLAESAGFEVERRRRYRPGRSGRTAGVVRRTLQRIAPKRDRGAHVILRLRPSAEQP